MNQFTSDIPVLTALTDDQVADYLHRNPNFFIDKPNLLAEMVLPHHSRGEAISLIERQVSILRDRNMDMRHRLNKLLDNARNNDLLFEKTRRLLLALLNSNQLNDSLDALFFSLHSDFEIQYAKLLLISTNKLCLPKSANHQIMLVRQEELSEMLPSLSNMQKTICGQLPTAEKDYIFKKRADDIGSTALAPLRSENNIIGLIAIGNRDPEYYRSSMNTLFLNFIAEALACLFTKFKVQGELEPTLS